MYSLFKDVILVISPGYVSLDDRLIREKQIGDDYEGSGGLISIEALGTEEKYETSRFRRGKLEIHVTSIIASAKLLS
jgi:hypothetical protein